jgi:hypothetical protein
MVRIHELVDRPQMADLDKLKKKKHTGFFGLNVITKEHFFKTNFDKIGPFRPITNISWVLTIVLLIFVLLSPKMVYFGQFKITISQCC